MSGVLIFKNIVKTKVETEGTESDSDTRNVQSKDEKVSPELGFYEVLTGSKTIYGYLISTATA